jgi:hypothetical protein
MNGQQPKKLTGWLIFLIIFVGFGSVGSGIRIVKDLMDSYEPYFEDYPSLLTAVRVSQLFIAISICTGGYMAWLLYEREPGTLPRAQNCLLLTAGLRIAAPGAIPILGGLPSDATEQLLQEWFVDALIGFAVTAAWYAYLSRSKKVREIYAPS